MYRELRSGGIFKKLRCLRGTSALEGFHLHLRKFFGAIYASPELLHTLLQEFMFRWNKRAGIKNCGEVDLGMFEHEIAQELYAITKPYVGTGNGKLIPKNPLRSADGAEYHPPEADDGRSFGLRPMLEKLSTVAPTAAAQPAVPSVDESMESEEEEEEAVHNPEDDSPLFSSTAHALVTQREHALLVKVVKQIQYPQGTEHLPRAIPWGDVFTQYNQEVAKQVQHKPRLGVELHHATKWQLKQAYERISKSITVTAMLKKRHGTLEAYKSLRRVLRAGTKLPQRLPHFGPVRSVQQIIQADRESDMESYHYKLPKKASADLALKYKRLLDSRRFCPLCREVCSTLDGKRRWRTVGRHSTNEGTRNDTWPICDLEKRRPTKLERRQEHRRVMNLKKKLTRRIDKMEEGMRKRKRGSALNNNDVHWFRVPLYE